MRFLRIRKSGLLIVRKKFPLMLLLIFLGASGCSPKRKIKVLTYNFEEYAIPVGTNAISMFLLKTSDAKEPDSLIHYYDYMLRQITTLNFYKKEIVKQTPILDEKYPIKSVSELISFKKGFLIRNQNYFYQLAESGEVVDRIDASKFDNMPQFKGAVSGFLSQVEEFSHPFNEKRELIYNAYPKIVDVKITYLDQPILTKVLWDEKRVENSSEVFPLRDFLEEGQTYGHALHPRLKIKGDSVFLSYKFSPNLYIYCISDLSLISKVNFSDTYEGLPNNTPITTAFFNDNYTQGDIYRSLMDDQYLYKEIIYDPYRKRYYRIQGEPPADYSKNNRAKNYYLITFNESLEPMGKLNLKKKYKPNLWVMPDGIYLQLIDGRENYIDLHKISIDLKNQ